VPSSVQVGLSKLAILSYANLLTSQLERGGENNSLMATSLRWRTHSTRTNYLPINGHNRAVGNKSIRPMWDITL
jgi:hypothetical protein